VKISFAAGGGGGGGKKKLKMFKCKTYPLALLSLINVLCHGQLLACRQLGQEEVADPGVPEDGTMMELPGPHSIAAEQWLVPPMGVSQGWLEVTIACSSRA